MDSVPKSSSMLKERTEKDALLPISHVPSQSSSTRHLSTCRSNLRMLAIASLLIFLTCCFPRFITSTPTAQSRNPAYLIKVQNGAVAAENERCSKIGVQVLKDGGNAVDAVVATTFCTGVVNMFSSGIGGGGFMTVRIPPTDAGLASEVWTIDFRETAPALSNTTMFASNPMSSRYGGLSVGVPGEVRGLEEAHQRWGSLPWARLVQPSIELAYGWEIDRELGRRLPWYADLMLNDEDWSALFAPHGRLLTVGESVSRPALARTLEKIADGGADAFYKGPVAEAIVRKVQQTGGILSLSDLATYRTNVTRALVGSYRGRKVYTTHAPTSGPVLLHILNLLEHYDLDERNGVNTHRLVEALKFGFAARTKVCDPVFADDTKKIDEISTKQFAESIVKNLTDDRTHTPDYYNPIYDVKIDHGTSHSSVVDKNGMAVALTSTVNLVFGSRVLDSETGILLNDEMDDFSTPGFPNGFGLWPSPYNYPEPGKRPLSSTSPTIMENEDGSFYLAIGGSGGSRIFGSVFQVILSMVDWGLDVSAAIEFGRLHDQLYPTYVDADDVYPQELLLDLQGRGHNVTVADVNRVAAVIQAVMQEGGTIYAASDSRKNGIAAGY